MPKSQLGGILYIFPPGRAAQQSKNSNKNTPHQTEEMNAEIKIHKLKKSSKEKAATSDKPTKQLVCSVTFYSTSSVEQSLDVN